MTDDTSTLPWWVQSIIAPMVSSMLIGAGGAYWGTQQAITQHTERIRNVQEQTDENRERLKGHDERIRKLQSRVEGRLTRIETKMDLLLSNKLDVSTGGSRNKDSP